MSKNREESVDKYCEGCVSWYGEGCYITEEYNYMIISGVFLSLYEVVQCREDGWVFCGQAEDKNYLFTWEGDKND